MSIPTIAVTTNSLPEIRTVRSVPSVVAILNQLVDELKAIEDELTHATDVERLQELQGQKQEIDSMLIKIRKSDQAISQSLEGL